MDLWKDDPFTGEERPKLIFSYIFRKGIDNAPLFKARAFAKNEKEAVSIVRQMELEDKTFSFYMADVGRWFDFDDQNVPYVTDNPQINERKKEIAEEQRKIRKEKEEAELQHHAKMKKEMRKLKDKSVDMYVDQIYDQIKYVKEGETLLRAVEKKVLSKKKEMMDELHKELVVEVTNKNLVKL